MIAKQWLRRRYFEDGKSLQDIATQLGCSLHKVNYWMTKHGLRTRTISEAIYKKYNPNGDPFSFRPPRNLSDAQLFGVGLGLYWGEGTKADKGSVRLGNTDPELLNTFIKFLAKFFSIKRSSLKFGLQIFTDIPVRSALKFWEEKLKVDRRQFYKVIITRSGSIGTYRKRSQYGVVTVYYHNKKARDLLASLLPL